MLTLTRAVGERIYIGDDIVVEVRAILDGRQVRISIDAPRQVPIHRAEIFEAVSRQNRASALAARPPAELAQLLGRAGTATAGAVPGPPAGEQGAAPGPVPGGEQAAGASPVAGGSPSAPGAGGSPAGSEAGGDGRAV